MFSVNTKLEGRPAHEALARARWWAWFAAGATALTLPLVPAMPVIHGLAVPLLGFGAWKLSKKHQELLNNFDELRKERGFRFVNNELPVPRDDKGRVIPWTNFWTAEWVPHSAEKVTDNYLVKGQPKQVIVWRKRLAGPAIWRKILEDQSTWVQEVTPERWAVVSAWWERWFLFPLLMRRFGTIDVDDEKTVAAAEDLKVELYYGICTAGQPHLWTRKIGCGKDEVECLGDLRSQLYSLYESLGAVEDVDVAEKQLATLDAKRSRPYPRHLLPVLDKFFIGRGFYWDQHHTQAYEDLLGRDLSDVTRDPAEQGDPRIIGVGGKDIRDLFMDEAQFNQMCGIFGSNGVGKTVYATCLIRQAIRCGFPVLILDPKSDPDLLPAAIEEARLCGRMHQFRYMTLASPRRRETWNWMARYNPDYTYVDPAELAARTAATLPSTKEPFWINVAKGMCQTCYTLCHWSNWFLRYLDRRGGMVLPPRDQAQVPMIILAMQFARHHDSMKPKEAEEGVRKILEKMRDPAWKPTQRDEQSVVDVLTLKSLEEACIYSPIEWIPAVRHISEYEVDNTIPFLGWMLRIFFPHLYLSSDRMAAPDFPRVAPQGGIVSKSAGQRVSTGSSKQADDVSMWSAFQGVRFHPLELRYIPNSSMPPEYDRWISFFDYFIPEPTEEDAREKDEYDLRRMFKAIRKALDNHYNDCMKERQKFLEYATTLQEAIKPFLGERARTICAIESDIVWDDVVKENQIVFCSLASMIDKAGSESCAKMLLEDLASYVGQRYQFRGDKGKPFWVIADELSSFVNDSFISLLNKSRGAGLRVGALGQTTPDLEKQLGVPGAKMAKGNFNTFIQLRSQLVEDAKDFAERAGQAKIVEANRSVSMTPGVGDAGHQAIKGFSTTENRSFQARTTSKVPPSAVLNLPRGQAWIHAKGQTALVSMGMFEPAKTFFQEEIGLFEVSRDGTPGVLREILVPYDHTPTSVKPRVKPPQRPPLIEDKPENQGSMPDLGDNPHYGAFQNDSDPSGLPVDATPYWAKGGAAGATAPPQKRASGRPSQPGGQAVESDIGTRGAATLAPISTQGGAALAEDAPAPASSHIKPGSKPPDKPSSVRDAAFDDGDDKPGDGNLFI